jgi:hypothetical protein
MSNKKRIVSVCICFIMCVPFCSIGTATPDMLSMLHQRNLEQKILSASEDFNFDMAYINDIYAELPWGGGVGFVNESFGLLINTGTEPITKEDIDSAYITVTSDVEGASLDIGFNTDNLLTPIQPNHAWGSVTEKNNFLVDLLDSGEELDNMTPAQTFFFIVNRLNFTGTALFNCSIQIRTRIIYLETQITYVEAPTHSVTLLAGERADSQLVSNSTLILTFGPITPLLNYSYIRLIDGDPSEIAKIQGFLHNRLIQFFFPLGKMVEVTNLTFSVEYPRELPSSPIYKNFMFGTFIMEGTSENTTETPHQVIVTGLNGVFFLARARIFELQPPIFIFAGEFSSATIITE